MTDNPNTILPSEFLDDVEIVTRENIDRESWTDIRKVKLGAIVGGQKFVRVPASLTKNKGEVYFTETDNSGQGTCINTQTEWLYDLQVKIGHPPDDKDRWYVQQIDVQNEINPVTSQPGVPPHGEQHSLRNLSYDGISTVGKVGSDVPLIDDRQMWQLGIFPYSGLQARIVPGWVMFEGKLYWYDGAILTDQTANVPAGAGNAAYVLVELDVDMTLTYTKGAEFTQLDPGAALSTFIPTGEDNTYKWVLLVVNGDTEFTYAHLRTGQHFRQVNAPPLISVSSATNTSGPGIYELDTTGGAVTLTLDSDDIAAAGRIIHVKDTGSDAGTNAITVDTEGAETIDGAASISISKDDGYASIYADGSNAHVLSKSINAGTVEIDDNFTIYIEQNQRNLNENIHGGLFSLSTGDALDPTPTNISVTAGVGKLILVINAGSDLAGDITFTGTTVNRDTGAETGADTDVITIDALTTDNSDTDAQGNARHSFTGAYITSKWFKGAVTISTADVTLTDVDTYQCSFEQFNDQSDITLKTFDCSTYITNTNAWFYAYLYTLEVTAPKVNLLRTSTLDLTVAASTANKAYRLRRGAIAKSLDGATDGFFVDLFLGPAASAYFEDTTLKVWYSVIKSITLS